MKGKILMSNVVRKTTDNRCRRCNRVLKDSSARYGWRCAEIMGAADSLNTSGDGAFSAYMQGFKAAVKYLRDNNIDVGDIDLIKYLTSYAKQYIALSMNDRELWRVAHEDMLDAINPPRDKNGKAVHTNGKSPSVEIYINKKDNQDFDNGKFTTTKFIDKQFDINTYELQKALNKAEITDKYGFGLKEDGIWGPKTQWAADVLKGTVPSTNFIDPLQKGLTNIGHRIKKTNTNSKNESFIFHQFYDSNTKERLFTIEKHKYGGEDMLHINIDKTKNANKLHKLISKSLDHTIVSEKMYEAFHDFYKVKGAVKTGGKAITAVAVILDAFELGTTIYDDLNDKDKKLGKKTLKTTTGIGGSWAGGIGGAKLGAMGGASIGSLICPGLGTVIGGFIGGIGGGLIGSLSGRVIGEFTVDKLYKGD